MEADHDTRMQREREEMVVYFARRERLIKIGTTRNLSARIRSLGGPGIVILATIPGGYLVERQILRQFSHLRTAGEWFEPAQELLDFIDSINSKPPQDRW